MLKFKLYSGSQRGKEIEFEASNLDDAKIIVKKFYPEHYYGCNIVCLDNTDFALVPVREYFEFYHKTKGIEMPV